MARIALSKKVLSIIIGSTWSQYPAEDRWIAIAKKYIPALAKQDGDNIQEFVVSEDIAYDILSDINAQLVEERLLEQAFSTSGKSEENNERS